ncbi:hypothetical protein ILYODFUR_002890 [Ilyodon furcidens]|uniref:Uncharacterized protein n=1 Tax=Ilyodon furcidens TaxID=33524 RepID=A0ABV0SJR9_9TELE
MFFCPLPASSLWGVGGKSGSSPSLVCLSSRWFKLFNYCSYSTYDRFFEKSYFLVFLLKIITHLPNLNGKFSCFPHFEDLIKEMGFCPVIFRVTGSHRSLLPKINSPSEPLREPVTEPS